MSHPLESVIRDAEGFLLVGDSSEERFPAFSYNAFTKANKRFFCLDLGGLTESRGPIKGGKVYTKVEDIPADGRGDLAIIWVKPHSAAKAVEVAHQFGAKRVWFSFQTGHADAVARAKELGLQVVEVGRCPVFYLDDKPVICAAHALVAKVGGTYGRSPTDTADPKRRELY